MSLTTQIAKHFRDVHFGGNWTCSNIKDNLGDVTWEEANSKVFSLNTIVQLTYHINYFVSAVLEVLKGNGLTAKDAFSFDHPPVQSQEDWQKLMDKTLADAAEFATLIEQLPEQKLWETFVDEKYGTYFRNLQGIIEHTHYHLGQIALMKKIIRQPVPANQ